MNPATDHADRFAKPDAPGRRLELHAIGGLRIRSAGADITEQMGPRHRALLAYLVHESRAMYPGELCTVLGRGREQDAELAGLRRAIAWLSDHVPGLKIEMSRDSIALVSRVWWDVRELDEAIDRRDVKAVGRLYRGDFLEGFSCGSGPFDEWAAEQRRELREYWEGAIRGRALEEEAARRWEASADWWRILADRSPLVGDLTVRAMRAYGRAHQRGEAARVFEAYLQRVSAAGKDSEGVVEAAARELAIPMPARPARVTRPQPEPAVRRQVDEVDRRVGAGDRRTVIQPKRRAGEDRSEAGVSFGAPTSRVSTMPGMEGFDDDRDAPVNVLGRGPRPLRPLEGSTLFTDSLLIHWTKTIWARLTTPRAIRAYRDAVERGVELSILTAQTLAYWSVIIARASWLFTRRAAKAVRGRVLRIRRRARLRVMRAGRGIGRVNRGIGRGVGRVGDGIGRSVARVGGGIERGVAQVGGGIGRAGKATARGVESTAVVSGRAGRGLGIRLAGLCRLALRPLMALPGLVLALLRAMGRGLARTVGSRAPAEARRRQTVSTAKLGRAVWRFIVATPGWTLRRRAELAGALAALILILAVPVAGDLILSGPEVAEPPAETSEEGVLTRSTVPQAAVREDAEQRSGPLLTLPDVSLPKVTFPTITLPKPHIKAPSLPEIASGVPDLVRQPMERLGALLSGPLLASGDRIIVADLNDGGPGGRPGLGHLAALVLESGLSESRRLSVVPRERVLVSASGRRDLTLRGSEALKLASDLDATAIITGRLDEGEGGSISSLRLAVVDVVSGTEVHGLELEIADGDWIAAMAEATRRLRRRLEGSEGAAEARHPDAALSSSLPALGAYARARAHLFSGRYGAAAAAVREAIRHDTAFAASHQLAAWAHALRGRRAAARRALDAAYRHRERLGGRERLRVVADREALAGRHTDAIIAYEYLFQSYRDDVVALKSLALQQRRIGARGGGTGNLEVAYSIEPVDWPPLNRIARYLAYRGTLPRVRVAGATVE